ncbi:MAG: hypothetical protein EXS08_15575 [Planctomycetes bacterium]|nr:hypothetical protein [Planctomycetota bacterium]
MPKRTRPLVLALHGAGGSESLFFESHAGGAIVPLCATRSWILVAPRLDLAEPINVPALAEAHAHTLPVERTRVFLGGHSLGALQACGAVNAEPSAFRTPALSAGGGGIREAAAWRELPVFSARRSPAHSRSSTECVDAYDAAPLARVLQASMPPVRSVTRWQPPARSRLAAIDER